MFELLIEIWRLPVAKIKREGVPRITNRIALKAIPLSLVADSQLHPRLTLKANRLFVDGNKDAGDPHVLGLLDELVDQALDLPKWILPLLLPWILMVVLHREVTAEVLPMLTCLDGIPRCQILPSKRLADHDRAKQWLFLLRAEPEVKLGL